MSSHPVPTVLLRAGAGLWPAWIALVCALALTLVAWRYAQQDQASQRQREFDAEVSRTRVDLEAHIADYAHCLQAAAAFFSAGKELAPGGWRDFVAALRIEHNYPAVRALAFAPAAAGDELPALVREIRRGGEADFSVRPPGARDRHVPYALVAHGDEANRRLLGYDLWQDADSRAAMQRAMQTGQYAISRMPAALGDGQGDSGPAFLMLLPAKSGRDGSIRGYVVGSLAISSLMGEFLRQGPRAVSLTIRDGADPGSAKLLHAAAGGSSPETLVHSEIMVVGGRPWNVTYTGEPESPGFMNRSTQVLAGGLLTSMLLFTIGWSFATNRDRAQRMAQDMTRSLRESEARFRVLVEQAPDAIVVYDVDLDRFIDANAQAERLFGCGREELLAGRLDRFYPPGLFDGKPAAEKVREMIERAMAGEQLVFDRTLCNAQGQLVRCEMRLVRLPAVDRRLLRGSFIDIGERKRIESDLRLAATTFESQEGVMITDAATTIIRVNRSFSAITGYSSAEAIGKTPRLLKSGRQDYGFYEAMWKSVTDSGTWSGEIWNRRKDGELYPAWLAITAVTNARGMVTHYVGTFTDITGRKAADDEIRQLAFYDALTGLPNRRLMFERLRQAVASSARHGRHGALMLFDLDDFKTLNDSLGHDVGDQFLVEVASRLASSVREIDTVARLGGDEFVVILEDLDAEALAAMQAESVAVKIQAALSQTYDLDLSLGGADGHRRSYHCTSSIGITLFRDQSASADELLKRADTAMYQAKSAGRNALRFFDPEMQAAVSARAALDTDLRAAVEGRQFVLHYQRQIDGDGRLTGAEALVRWQHPRRGLVYPAEFMGLAEETRLIVPLGQWILLSACRQLADWAQRGSTADLTLAVNISARQFQQRDFVEQVLSVLGQTGANPRRLKLELTESLLLQDVEDVVAKMTVLKEEGVSFALDDFGTGYSSLFFLKHLPLVQLKIDQSLVRHLLTDTNDAAIARGVIALGQSLGLGVIAEGVETEAQRHFLARHGCTAYQGYLFGRPGAVDELFVGRRTEGSVD